LTATGIVSASDWDHFGFSFYPFYGTSATYNNLRNTLNTLADLYNKPMQVVETDWPVRCEGSGAPQLSEPNVPRSVDGQRQWVQGIADVVRGVKNGLGRGIHYWEPAWYVGH
jgi:arabinogalactan endo-1,4-beta-galactosidase